MGQDVVGQNFVGQDVTGAISLGQEVSGAGGSGAGSSDHMETISVNAFCGQVFVTSVIIMQSLKYFSVDTSR